MKDKKIVDYIFAVVPFIIAFILEYNLSNLLRLNKEKIFSVGTAISLVIFVAIYAMATIVISVLRDKNGINKATTKTTNTKTTNSKSAYSKTTNTRTTNAKKRNKRK